MTREKDIVHDERKILLSTCWKMYDIVVGICVGVTGFVKVSSGKSVLSIVAEANIAGPNWIRSVICLQPMNIGKKIM